MARIDELLLLSGNDIPFRTGRCSVHQPRISEIAYIGEEAFHIGVRFLLFNKDNLDMQDKSGLENQSNFNIFMSVMNSAESAKHKTDAILVLTLMFPNAKVKIEKDKILLQLENFESSVNEYNFDEFQDIVRQIFCVSSMGGENGQYNPADELANKIAEKFKKRQQKLAGMKDEVQKVNIFSRYASILVVGLQKDMNQIMQYTVYQIMDEFERFRLKQDFDIYVQAKMAGAKDMEEVKNWMEDIHS
jgi:hypothetical protein